MKIEKYETTVIPQTEYGRKFADEYSKRLKEQNAFLEMTYYTDIIQIKAKYHFRIKEE